MTDPETRYPDIEKLALALICSARKLRPYFQAHSIQVLTNHPLRQVLQKPETSGRLVRWAVELSEFDITFKPRAAEKGQAIADFISEFTSPATPEAITANASSVTTNLGINASNPDGLNWKLYVDGSANSKGCGAGIVLISPGNDTFEYSLRLGFKASNNVAEYEALLAGLRLAKEVGAENISIFSDSQLVVNQVMENFAAKDNSMASYLAQVTYNLSHFKSYKITQIPRTENSHADALSRLASAMAEPTKRNIPVETLASPSSLSLGVMQVEIDNSWMQPIRAFLTNGTLPEDPLEARRLQRRATRYTIMQGKLYKRGFSEPCLRCLTPTEGAKVLQEVHEGICGNHSGARALAHKVLRQGYYWPTLNADAHAYTQKCEKCQRFATIPHMPAEPLTPIVSPWPFAQWGLDLIGPMPSGKGQVKFAVVAVDYFTKWVEAEALATITAAKMKSFIWRHIICRFGIPNAIITDNGPQFDSKIFRSFCQTLGVNLFFASPAHPQSNGQVEAINKIIKRTLKTRLDKAKGCWPDLLHEVLWSYRTTFKTATDETPFSLAFGSEAVVPVEIKEPTYRLEAFEPEQNQESLAVNLDLLEEKREQAQTRNLIYKQRISRYYDARVRNRTFKVGDWVLRKVNPTTKDSRQGTLGPNWEGPYEITRICRKGTYELRDAEGRTLGHPWNVDHLKYFYK